MKVSASLVRFVLEAGFLVLVAAATAVARLSDAAIIFVMVMAWLLMVLVERTAAYDRRALRSGRLGFLFRGRADPGREDALPPTPAFEQPAPTEQAARRPSLRERLQARRPEPVDPVQPEPEPPPSHVRVLTNAATPAIEAEIPRETETEAAPEAVELSEPVREPDPEPEAPVAAEPLPPAPELREAPPPQPAPEPVPPPLAPEPEGVLAFVPRANGPRQWNIWELERIAREREGADSARDEERALLLMELRQFATADGMLATSFDGLVRESFGELIGHAAR